MNLRTVAMTGCITAAIANILGFGKLDAAGGGNFAFAEAMQPSPRELTQHCLRHICFRTSKDGATSVVLAHNLLRRTLFPPECSTKARMCRCLELLIGTHAARVRRKINEGSPPVRPDGHSR